MPGPLPDLSPFFGRYEQYAREADALFARVRGQYPDLVSCREKCSDCCHALFDLCLVEALYLNAKFRERYQGTPLYETIMDAADSADRKTARLKRDIFKASQAGTDSNELLAQVAAQRMRCPLLGDDELCLLYEARPITCRLYGVPTAIGGKAHTCGHTGFKHGTSYPTVALDKMQHRLSALSSELAKAIGSSFKELDLVFVPVSSALITRYDAAFLGLEKREGDGL